MSEESAFQSGYDSAIEQSNFGYSSAMQSTVGIQSQVSTGSYPSEESSTSLYCLSIIVCFCVSTFLGIAIIALVSGTSDELATDKNDDILGGSGGSGRGGGSVPSFPTPRPPVTKAGDTTMPVTHPSHDPHQLSTDVTQTHAATPSTPPSMPRGSSSPSRFSTAPATPHYTPTDVSATPPRPPVPRPTPRVPAPIPGGPTRRPTPTTAAPGPHVITTRATPSRQSVTTLPTLSTPTPAQRTATKPATRRPTSTPRPTTSRRTLRPTPRPTPAPRPSTTRPTARPTTPAPRTTRRTRPTTPTVVTRRTRKTTTPVPFLEAPVVPNSTFLCTVSEPVRNTKGKSVLYLPPDGICDFIFYDSLYKDGKNTVIGGIGRWEQAPRSFLEEASKFSRTAFGFSFAPEPTFLQEAKRPAFFGRLISVWNENISHFGLLNIYREYTEVAVVTDALIALKALYLYLKPRFTSTRPSFYVVGMSLDNPASMPVLKLMTTVFAPSMFIAIAHLSYPVRKFKDCRVFPVVLERLPPNLIRGKDYTYGHTFACDGKQYNLKLQFALAAYDVDFDSRGTCTELGFYPLSGAYSITLNAKVLSNRLLAGFGNTSVYLSCRFPDVFG